MNVYRMSPPRRTHAPAFPCCHTRTDIAMKSSYEKVLHGTTGVEQMETSAGGYAVRRLASHPSTPSSRVMSTAVAVAAAATGGSSASPIRLARSASSIARIIVT